MTAERTATEPTESYADEPTAREDVVDGRGTRPSRPWASPGRPVISLAAATAVAVLTGEALAGSGPTVAGTAPLAAGLALALLAGWRWPLAALLVSVQMVIACRAADLFDAGWIWPASAAYFVVAASERPVRGRLRRLMSSGPALAVAVGVFQVAFAANWQLFVAGAETREVVAGLGAETLWLGLVLAAATAYRNWRRWRAELSAGLERKARERELTARGRAEAERLRIARELHDVVAHTLTVVGVQLRVAVEAMEDSPEEARDALDTAQRVRTTAVNDLRALLGVLRDPSDAAGPAMQLAPERGLEGIGDLLAQTRAAGLETGIEIFGNPEAVPAPVALAVHRIVQESLTNAIRHSGGGRVDVTLRCGPDVVDVLVRDDGSGGAPHASAGYGVRGMRERVSALGGTFSAGPAAPDDGRGGYSVRAVIPVPSY
ncbi:sensor histidine kinase [Streptomyces sp. NPDC059897]|uniref:sensor histidine kinase n=1 Tax=Streptomyces sp. NPDC059897 TaxID=3346994 RepID=UPI00364A8773